MPSGPSDERDATLVRGRPASLLADTVEQADFSVRQDRPKTFQGQRPGDRYVRVGIRRSPRASDTASADYRVLPETPAAETLSGPRRVLAATKRVLIGRPIASAQEHKERLGVFTGLPVFASDNISSSAYATEEIMRVLVLAGVGALSLTLPITLAIIAVLAIVVTSYQQTIAAYPNGGGSYIVASDNLGHAAGLTAAGALLVDYVLTVSVSIAAGIAALTSLFPSFYPHRVALCVGCVALLCLGNLRGIRESGAIFAAPTYLYLIAIAGLFAWAVLRFMTGNVPTYTAPAAWHGAYATRTLGLVLILRAFSSGAVALSGVEAVSNGIPAFKAPETKRARTVLILMGSSFGVIFLGISFLAGHLGILPDPSEQETVISQIARAFVGNGPYLYFIQFATALILVLAANTAFADFPRLLSILARDRFVPRAFAFRGDRLAFTSGIVLLSLLATLLIVVFGGSVTHLIPLYTIGVFVAFTLSQAGMVKHWWVRRHGDQSWEWRAAVNGIGAVTTGVVAVEVAISKFLLGAWIVLLLVPLMILLMWGIGRHYSRMAGAQQPETPLRPDEVRVRPIVPIADLNIPAKQALAFARAIAPDEEVALVHVTDDVAAADRLRKEWQAWPHGRARLIVIESPYRSLGGPLLRYLDEEDAAHPGDTMLVVLPEYVPGHWWEQLLHNQTALRLKAALLFHHPGIIVASVPYHVALHDGQA